ncbi:MAG: MBOAT family protein [Planctomycetota bacterium]|nr:MBOAT family protein [Planctomycetota bacterium]
MLFNSYIFLFAFLPVVLAGFLVLRWTQHRRLALSWLVLASFVYYAWWKPAVLLLLIGSILVNAAFGAVLCSPLRFPRARKAILVAGLIFNIGLLCYFKYTGFFVVNLNSLFGAGLPVPDIILPIGISFITFQKIAFLIDAYRGEVKDFSLANFTLFVSFFPQLIAGPIVHHSDVMPQFAAGPDRRGLHDDLAVGLSLFIVGLFKKAVIADTCARYADAGFAALHVTRYTQLAPPSAWVTMFAYSFQIYYDFSGYSDMAVGLARMFGVRFPMNFNSPYKAANIVDFWRRWHITLSRFLRDYLYIPLGGNRRGPVRQNANLVVVMVLGGLWHGAHWTFVLWGAMHGLMLACNHIWTRTRFASWRALRLACLPLTFLAVTVAWVPFRATDIDESMRMFRSLFPPKEEIFITAAYFMDFFKSQFYDLPRAFDVVNWFTPPELWPRPLPYAFVHNDHPVGLVLLTVGLLTFLLPNTSEVFAAFNPVLGMSPDQLWRTGSLRRLDWRLGFALAGMLVISLVQLSHVSPFLYFQF